MTLSSDTRTILREIERSSARSLNYGDEVGSLIELAHQQQLADVFNELIFLAKFVTKSSVVMKRIGNGGEGYDKLAAEFQSVLEKVSALLKKIVGLAPEESRHRMLSLFFALTPESLEHLMLLISDLSAVKNWVLDGGRLPGELGG